MRRWPAVSSLKILGTGSHARMLAEILHSQDGVRPEMLPIKDAVTRDCRLIIGLGNTPITGNPGLWVRRQLYQEFLPQIVGVQSVSAIIYGSAHPTAQILTRAIIHPGAGVGANTIINTGAIIEHDCKIGNHVHIAPGAICLGGCIIGDETHIGAGAVIKQGVKIGMGCVVGMGARVLKDVSDGETRL